MRTSFTDVDSNPHALAGELAGTAFSGDTPVALVGTTGAEPAVRLGEAAILTVLVALVVISLLDTLYLALTRDDRRLRPKR